jgi:hypothetical protein
MATDSCPARTERNECCSEGSQFAGKHRTGFASRLFEIVRKVLANNGRATARRPLTARVYLVSKSVHTRDITVLVVLVIVRGPISHEWPLTRRQDDRQVCGRQ